jgi:hypothetical protein
MGGMDDIILEQALYGGHGSGGYRFLARSSGFRDEWLPLAERLCIDFGDRPANVACPAAVFAQPFGSAHVAVVQVADQGRDDTGRPGALAFRLLVLSRADYARLEGDPFRIAAELPPDWQARDLVSPLTWSAGPPSRRTVAQVQEALQRPAGPILIPDSPVRQGGSHVLLGGAQALLDGARLVFVRPAPDPELLRDLWLLLPTASRCQLWPATFAFDTRLSLDVVVVPPARSPFAPPPPGDGRRPVGPVSYMTEAQAADYPEGRYELSLQSAAESGDQRALDSLFARRTRGEMLRLAATLLGVVLVLALIINWLPWPKPQAGPAPQEPPAPAGASAPVLDPVEKYPVLTRDERQRLTAALAQLASQLALPPQATAEDYLKAIDTRLGTPDAKRAPGPLSAYGPVQRQLQVLCWKHGIENYAHPGLAPQELVEKLQEKVKDRPAP